MPARKTLPAQLKRKKKTVEIQGTEIEFLAPAVVQRALVLEFVIRAIAITQLSKQKIDSLTRDELIEAIRPRMEEFDRLSTATTSGKASAREQVEMMYLMGSFFGNPENNAILYTAISQCFPQIPDPAELSDEATYEVFGLLLGEVSPNEADARDIRQLIDTA